MAHSSAKKGIAKQSGVPMVDMDVLMKEETEFLTKALNREDAPPKEKHVRSAVVATYQENGCTVFFSILETRLNMWPFTVPIVGYKTLFLYHRLLRDGHPRVLKQSRGHYSDVISRMREAFDFKDDVGYCALTRLYANVILKKIDFHLKHEEFTGLVREEGVKLAVLEKPDMNMLFELMSEILDFLEVQIKFMASVHRFLDPSAKLPTSHTHCVIHPLLNMVPEAYATTMAVQDIYLSLATSLDAETLEGHRKRFMTYHGHISRLFGATGQLSYVMGILREMPKIPRLPQVVTSPKKTVVPQVVELPPKKEPGPFERTFSSSFDFKSESALDRQVALLTKRVADLVLEIENLKSERMEDHQRLFDSQNEVSMLKNELLDMKRENGELKEEVAAAAAATDTTEQMAAANAKFSRLKELYTKLRDDHVALIRQKAQSDKQVSKLNDRSIDQDAELEALKASLVTATEELTLIQASLQAAEGHASTTQTRAADMEKDLHGRIGELESELAERNEQVQTLQIDLTIVQHEQASLEESRKAAEAQITDLQSHASDSDKDSQQRIADLQEQISSRSAAFELLLAQCSTKTSEANRLQEDLAAAQFSAALLTQQSSETQSQAVGKIESLEAMLVQREAAVKTLTANFEMERQQSTSLREELSSTQGLSQSREEQLAAAHSEASNLQALMDAKLAEEQQRLRDLNHGILVHALEEAQEVLHDPPTGRSVTVTASSLVKCTQSAIERCTELEESLQAYCQDHTKVGQASVAVSGLSHSLCRVIEDANAVSAANSSTVMVEQVHRVADTCTAAFESLKDENLSESAVTAAISSSLTVLAALSKDAQDLVPAEQQKTEEVGNSVDVEMNMMFEAVAQAAKRIEAMMERSKETDTGEQLEVNSSILESSGGLMTAIRQLIKDSRSLQEEIVDQGKGTLTTDQFYQKNGRWTEGLLSAAQMVGHGAQHLVECADNVVTGKGKFEELQVASHEIAASTAQLVAASKAKAGKNSVRLSALKASSKIVTENTGHVVVSAKSAVKAKKRADQPDYSKLSALQGKRREMEIQVRLLELEAEVEHTRNQLGEVRRLGYAEGSTSKPPSGRSTPY